jgi:hypothetical protein
MSWWVVYDNTSGDEVTGHAVQAAARPAIAGNVEYVIGPFASQAAANAQFGTSAAVAKGATFTGAGGAPSIGSLAKSALGGGYQLVFGNAAGLAGRIFKVIIGGVLIISGIIHLSGADKTVLGIAGKAVLPA